MAGNKTRTTNMDSDSIDALPNDRPVLYRILNQRGENVYTGVARRGNVRDRLKAHLPGGDDPVPGAVKVRIEQKDSIDQARQSEARVIARSRPKHNKQGK